MSSLPPGDPNRNTWAAELSLERARLAAAINAHAARQRDRIARVTALGLFFLSAVVLCALAWVEIFQLIGLAI